MFETFTDRARRTIVRAMEEAQRRGADQVRPEHLLLTLVGEDGDSVVTDFKSVPFDPQVREILTRAYREAAECGSSTTGNQHILLAMLGDVELLGRLHGVLHRDEVPAGEHS